MNILIVDNYDSFTYNLYQSVGEILSNSKKKFRLTVARNDQITMRDIHHRGFDRVILSPGPGNPADRNYFGVCADILTTAFGKTHPILGVCLGMQGMAYYFGGIISPAQVPMHGKTSIISHDSLGIFHGLPQNLEVMRYHSLVASKTNLPNCLKITARSKDSDEIMGLRHTNYPIEGIQFHPESFATEGGKTMILNFLFGRRTI